MINVKVPIPVRKKFIKEGDASCSVFLNRMLDITKVSTAKIANNSPVIISFGSGLLKFVPNRSIKYKKLKNRTASEIPLNNFIYNNKFVLFYKNKRFFHRRFVMSKKTEEPMKNIKNNENEDKEKEIEPRREEEESGKPIVIKAEAYKTIILYASRYSNQAIPPAEWKEIYGILIGHITDAVVIVERAEALTFGHSTDVQLDERHYGFIESIENKLYEENLGCFIVGWFHSHPGLGLFYSYVDLINHIGFQGKNKDACGLVFDHTLLGKKKRKKVANSEHMITKYDTGFEIYRMNDVNMDINDPGFENNYHKVDYFIDGLNKFFFANVMTELSALVTSGKPLQSAYGENVSSYTPQFTHHPEKIHEYLNKESDINHKNISQETMPELNEIPLEIDGEFEMKDIFRDAPEIMQSEIHDNSQKLKMADELFFEGNQAFRQKNSFEGVEKYKKGLEILKDINKIDKVMEYLSKLSENCLHNNHYPLAEQNSEELFKIAESNGSLFYMAGSKYIIGFIKIIKDSIKEGLEDIQQAAIFYENTMDFYGTGLCNQKIAAIYSTHLKDIDRASLFFLEALKNFNKALEKIHPLRITVWDSPKHINERINNLKETIKKNLKKIIDQNVKSKIESDLKNFE